MKNLIFGVKQGKYKKGKNPVDIASVAIWNEYGTRNIPPRPAFRMGLEHGIKRNKKLIESQLKNIAQRILSGRKSEIERGLTVMLTQIGRSAKAETKNIIKSGSTTPNAESTIKRKGFDHPLYEEGLLLESVDYEVTD